LTQGATKSQSQFSSHGSITFEHMRHAHGGDANGIRKSGLGHGEFIQRFTKKFGGVNSR
jgi:hypothetical protein